MRIRHDNGVGITELHNQVLSLLLGLVTNAEDGELLLEALGNANDHVVDEGSCEAVLCAGVLRVARSEADLSVLQLRFDLFADLFA